MKPGFWLKGATGKIAGITLYKDSSTGETVGREIVTPSNPKTDKQLIQRVVMHTVGSSFAKMKEIVDHSFEGFKKGRDTQSYYIQQNIMWLRQRISQQIKSGYTLEEINGFLPLKQKGFVANEYQVSMGSLPRVQAKWGDADGVVAAITTNTYKAVIDALGLQRGDQLTFLVLDQPFGSSDKFIGFHYARVILDPTNADGTAAPLTTAFITDGAITLPSVRNEGSLTMSIDSTGLHFSNGENTLLGVAVIVSREAGDGKWLRSTEYLAVEGVEGYDLQTCIDSAKAGTATAINMPNSVYLNNAGVNSTAASTEGGGGLPGGGGSESGSGQQGGGLPAGGSETEP
jgi:hypothetical protein